MPFVEPPPPPPPSREPDAATAVVVPAALRPWLERLRASAIAEANELSRLLGMPTVTTAREWAKRNGEGR